MMRRATFSGQGMSDFGELYAGRKLGRYELLVPLAQGGTADVWAARMTGAAPREDRRRQGHVRRALRGRGRGRRVACSSTRRGSSRASATPTSATVLDLGEEEDVLFIVMEWVEGEPLQVVLREAQGRSMPLPLALRIVKQAAAGLHAAHELCDEDGKPVGLVHRDVSPQNILVGYDGVVKVIDFGVAKADVEPAADQRRPDQGQGAVHGARAGDGRARSTGAPTSSRSAWCSTSSSPASTPSAARASSPRSRASATRTPPSSPRRHVPDVPAALEEAMLKALAKQREERFATMLDLARALERAVPSPPDVDRVLGAFLSELLSQRAAKREQSIRDALREHTGKDTRPVNLGVRPTFKEGSSGIRSVRALLGGKASGEDGAASAPEAPRRARRSTAPLGAPPRERTRPGAPRSPIPAAPAGSDVAPTPGSPATLQPPARSPPPARAGDAHRRRDRDRRGAAAGDHRGHGRVARAATRSRSSARSEAGGARRRRSTC